jgi:hypothetical protein
LHFFFKKKEFFIQKKCPVFIESKKVIKDFFSFAKGWQCPPSSAHGGRQRRHKRRPAVRGVGERRGRRRKRNRLRLSLLHHLRRPPPAPVLMASRDGEEGHKTNEREKWTGEALAASKEAVAQTAPREGVSGDLREADTGVEAELGLEFVSPTSKAQLFGALTAEEKEKKRRELSAMLKALGEGEDNVRPFKSAASPNLAGGVGVAVGDGVQSPPTGSGGGMLELSSGESELDDKGDGSDFGSNSFDLDNDRAAERKRGRQAVVPSLAEATAIVQTVAQFNFLAAPFGKVGEWEKACLKEIKKKGFTWSGQGDAKQQLP